MTEAMELIINAVIKFVAGIVLIIIYWYILSLRKRKQADNSGSVQEAYYRIVRML